MYELFYRRFSYVQEILIRYCVSLDIIADCRLGEVHRQRYRFRSHHRCC